MVGEGDPDPDQVADVCDQRCERARVRSDDVGPCRSAVRAPLPLEAEEDTDKSVEIGDCRCVDRQRVVHPRTSGNRDSGAIDDDRRTGCRSVDGHDHRTDDCDRRVRRQTCRTADVVKDRRDDAKSVTDLTCGRCEARSCRNLSPDVRRPLLFPGEGDGADAVGVDDRSVPRGKREPDRRDTGDCRNAGRRCVDRDHSPRNRNRGVTELQTLDVEERVGAVHERPACVGNRDRSVGVQGDVVVGPHV